jgi:Camelysin metallo-endopeptidase
MSTRTAQPRHRVAKPRKRMVRGMLASATAIAGASIIAALAAGGTYALWNGERSIPSATITSGTLGLTVNGGSSGVLDGTAWSKLLPGDIVSQEVTVKNTGDVAGTVSATTTGGFSPLLVHVKKGACGATIVGTSSTVSPTSLGAFLPSEQSLVCVQVTMPATAPAGTQGTSQAFTITFTSKAGS